MRLVHIRSVALLSIAAIAAVGHASDDDWAYELPDTGKAIFEAGQPPRSCNHLNAEMDALTVYHVIRDAGLFRDSSCGDHIGKLPDDLAGEPAVLDAIRFYQVRLGDVSRLAPLLDSFDRRAREIGDDITVELFGFLPDWEHTGRRLARHSRYSDGAGSELLRSALQWKLYLYGREPGFHESCLQVVNEEQVRERWVAAFCGAQE